MLIFLVALIVHQPSMLKVSGWLRLLVLLTITTHQGYTTDSTPNGINKNPLKSSNRYSFEAIFYGLLATDRIHKNKRSLKHSIRRVDTCLIRKYQHFSDMD